MVPLVEEGDEEGDGAVGVGCQRHVSSTEMSEKRREEAWALLI